MRNACNTGMTGYGEAADGAERVGNDGSAGSDDRLQSGCFARNTRNTKIESYSRKIASGAITHTHQRMSEHRIYRALCHHIYNITKVYREARTQDLLCKVRYKQAGHYSMPTYYGVLCSMSIILSITMIFTAVRSKDVA